MRTYKPHTQVAHRTSRRIDEVDGVPTTHTQRGWTHAWTVTDDPANAAPLPFAAKQPIPAVIAVPAMVLVTETVAVLAMLTVLDGRTNRLAIILLFIVGQLAFCALLMVPAVLRGRR